VILLIVGPSTLVACRDVCRPSSIFPIMTVSMEPTPNAMSQDVIRFTAERFPVMAGRLSLETTLLGDLRVDGDDAVDFLTAFSKNFGVL